MSDSDKAIYKEGTISLSEFASVVKSLKGKWLVSLNDSAEVRRAFSGFKIKSFTTGGTGNLEGAQGEKNRREVLIMNYGQNKI